LVSNVGSLGRHSIVEVDSGGSSRGFCYLEAIRNDKRDQVRVKLGANPTFSEVLSLPEQWFGESLTGLFVTRVRSGVYHLGGTGFSAGMCFHSVVVKAQSLGHEFALGTKAYALSQSSARLYHVDRAPGWSDVLGSGYLFSGDLVRARQYGLTDDVLQLLVDERHWDVSEYLCVLDTALEHAVVARQGLRGYVGSVLSEFGGDDKSADGVGFPGHTVADVDEILRLVTIKLEADLSAAQSPSELTTLVESFPSGYCYLALVVPEHRYMAKLCCGAFPMFEVLLAQPDLWFDHAVVRQCGMVGTGPDYHVRVGAHPGLGSVLAQVAASLSADVLAKYYTGMLLGKVVRSYSAGSYSGLRSEHCLGGFILGT